MIRDDFAGPGGWDEGLALLGRRDVVGVEWDRAACDTALAAGHARIWADVANLPNDAYVGAYGRVEGYIASPPCQAWSMAGNRKGELDRASCHRLADRMATGDDSTDWTTWEDERSPLVCQPVRQVRDLQPTWIALEEVPAVASLWEHFARIFHGWGYKVWTGDLNSADYGVPQTRTRRILMAHRTRTVHPPVPTHAQNPEPGADLFGGELLPWVSMAEALGWGFDTEPSCTVSGGGGDTGGPEPFANAGYRRRLNAWVTTSENGRQASPGFNPVERPARTVPGHDLGKHGWFVSAGMTGEGRPKDDLRLVNGAQKNATVRRVDQPAPTIVSAMANGDTKWVYDRPATTVVGSYCPDVIAAPGYRTQESRQNAAGSVRVTVQEAGILQSFRPDYPWRGSRTKQFQQVGNAIPPILAAHILAALGVGTLAHKEAAA